MAYTFENGAWGTYDDGIVKLDKFHQAREKLGFTDHRKLVSLVGEVTIYTRSDTSVKWPYSYLCLLEVVDTCSWVWIKVLPDLFKFLQEIQAHDNDRDELTGYLRDKTWFAEAMQELYGYFNRKNSES